MTDNENGREEELFAIRTLMNIENGRSFMFRCLQHCGTYGSVFDKDSSKHAYNSGMRDHGVWLEGELKEAASESFLTMLRENTDGR